MSYTSDRFWVAAQPLTAGPRADISGLMYVEHLIPVTPNGQPPFLLIHGGGGQGTDWLQTPDGRPGWATLLAGKGYDVYVVDRIGHGRSSYDPAVLGDRRSPLPAEMMAALFFPPIRGEGSHPTAGAHTQWPGERSADSPAAQQLLASQTPIPIDTETAQRLDQSALVELLDKIGPAVVMSHSAGGPAGFLLADARADKVIALVACEPLGPPLLGAPGMPLAWGVANAPLTYTPAVNTPADLSFTVNDSGPVPLALQNQPARQLTELAKVPMMLVTGEASVFRWFENSTAAYLQQAGCPVTSIRLWEHGIRGNAHGFIFEKNNADILDLLLTRLPSITGKDKHVSTTTERQMMTVTTTAVDMEAVIADLRALLGHDAVLVDGDIAEFVDPYEPLTWGGQRNGLVVQPTTTEQVQSVVRLANHYQIPLWVGSQGRNNGYGGHGSVVAGSIIVNLRKMNKVLEVNDRLGYVVVEPGVSFFDLYDYARAHGKDVMIDVPDLGWGSIIGNTADRGFGYTKYGNHYEAVCGMEVVLPDGEILRTGMGGLADPRSWHVYRTGYGPNPEGLFLQSNFGIITRMGLWCMPMPDVYMNCIVRVEADQHLDAMIEAIRPLMVDGTIANIPSCFNVAGVMTMMGKRKDFWEGEGPIPQAVLDAVQQKTGLGAWMMRFALYGREGQVDESFAHIQRVLSELPGISVQGAKYDPRTVDPETLDQSGKVQGGIPDLSMLPAVKFVGDNGGHVGFSSVVPLTGQDARSIIELVRDECATNGVDYTATFMVTPRSAIHVSLFFFDRDDIPQTQRAYDMCRATVQKAAAVGYGEYRSHVSTMDVVADQFSWNDGAQRRFNEKIKNALDPNGILMPGRSGIWPEKYHGQDIPMPWKK